MFTQSEIRTLARAKNILFKAVKTGPVFNSPQVLKDYLQIQTGLNDREVFGVVYLDSQHRLIEYVHEFHGTLNQTSVYPREIVRRALSLNAGAVVLVHNHPSGNLEPSRADELLTTTLKSSLALVDVKVLDHFIVAPTGCLSFAERGLI
jgi:DNA repair protein RadC